MTTVRQMERLWSAKAYGRLLEQLVEQRPESCAKLMLQMPGSLPAAALTVIRLDELSQSFVPLYSQLVRTILVAQRLDGGWGDVITTAMCLRALLCGNGNGEAIDQGLAFLAELQKPEGIWPGMPVKRMPIDPFASAFVLLQLSGSQAFRCAVRFDEAIEWFKAHALALEESSAKIWSHTSRRLPETSQNKRSAKGLGLNDRLWTQDIMISRTELTGSR